MTYDKNVLKNHYAKPCLTIIRVGIILVLVCLALFLLASVAFGPGHYLPEFLVPLAYFVTAFMGFYPIFILPALFCHYIKLKRMSERQRQWITDGVLYVTMIPESGFTWGGFVDHKITYEVIQPKLIEQTTKFFIISGQIRVIDSYNGVVREKFKSQLKLPRNFLGEEQLFQTHNA